ncbi:MAG TPA: TetR/AcrR family transcriptional regulator [Arachnia sp.]|nr:TetR/AcrR family transcriptional regulator [Arachnia sp.]HMT86915.1 TetR/AcrR family transcriptional regulator [Arachnia sp.]
MNFGKEVDGRTARWEQHNEERRHELIQEALRAIRLHGPGVGMDEIAAQAKTSKTVLYRHFGTRLGLHQAIVEATHSFIFASLPLDDVESLEPRALIHELADAYLSLVERDPHIYAFVITRPGGDDTDEHPVLALTARIGNEISRAMASWLRRNGHDEQAANTWGHGVVGFVYAVADRWILTQHKRPREDVVGFIDDMFSATFSSSLTPRSIR